MGLIHRRFYFQLSILFMLIAMGLSACGGSSSSSSSGGGSTLATPQGLSVSARNASVLLDWSEVAGATAYNVYYATDPDIDIDNPGSGSGNWDWVSDVTPPHTLDMLDNGVTYYLVITATDGERESSASDESSVTPRAGISGREIRTTTRSVGSDSYQHTLNGTFCDEGDVVVGGGFRIVSEGDEDAALRIHSSFPTSGGSGDGRIYNWAGRAYNENDLAEDGIELQTQVICIDEPDDFERVRNTSLALDAGVSEVFSSECTGDNIALTGGAVLTGVNSDDPGIRLAYSQRDADTEAAWQTTLHNVGIEDHESIASIVLCAAQLRGLSVETSYAVRPEEFVPAGTFGERSVVCDAAQSVTHGGPYRQGDAADQPTDLVLQQSYPDTDDQGRDVWRVKVYNSAAEALPMGAFAVCVDSDD